MNNTKIAVSGAHEEFLVNVRRGRNHKGAVAGWSCAVQSGDEARGAIS
jgi:hypothetical protein